MSRPKVGDLVLVTNTAHFEKTEIVERKKGLYTLANGIKMDKDFHPLNSKCKLKPFSENEYEYLLCQRDIPRFLRTIEGGYKSCSQHIALKLHRKLGKLVKIVS